MHPLGRRQRGLLARGARVALLLVAAGIAFKVGPIIYNKARLRRLQGTHVYDERTDGKAELEEALPRAAREHKSVLVILGGNWCQWCLAFDDLMSRDREIQVLIADRYLVLRLDADAAADLDEAWGRPTRLGVPVLVFLDSRGSVIHVQETVSLEVLGGRLLLHDRGRVLHLLQEWAGRFE